jgi:DNA-binding winged helix-turn-helix (wHTH) protein
MRVSFGEFVLDSERRLLERRGEPVHLSPKAFGVLELLMAERPRAVSKQVLLDRIWPDVVVEEQNVKTAIFEIRTALGEAGSFIRTLQRYGYAFAADTQPKVAEDTGARLLTRDHTYALRSGENLIGRDASCPIALTATGVSRRHARIEICDGGALLEDLGSKNGTWRNDERIATAVELSDGDSIRIGIVRLTFRSKPLSGKTTTLS